MSEYAEEFDPGQEDETVDDKALTALIDEWLTDARPERYDRADKDWMDAIIDKAAFILEERPTREIARDAARRRVNGRETQAARQTARLFRQIAKAQQLPLWWGGENDQEAARYYFRLPVILGEARVRLGVLSGPDLESYIADHAAQRDREVISREATINGAALVLELVLQQNVRRAEDLRT